MTEENSLQELTVDQMAVMLDNIPTAIVVSAADNRELLYANRLAKEFFLSKDKERGITCYEAVGFEQPCPSCQEKKMTSDYLTRQFTHPVNKRVYRLSGRRIDWSGRPADIEYVVDITESQEKEEQTHHLEKELFHANEKMQDIINAIPGGVAIYKVSDIFKTEYFSEGVSALSGYTVEEYQEVIKEDAINLVYPEDSAMVVSKLREAIREHTVADFEFRKLHRNGGMVWVHIQAKQIGEEDGFPLLQCVFHNVTTLRETQHRMNHLINSIPGGIASYRVEGGKFIPVYYSDGVPSISGYTREEYEEWIADDAFNVIYEGDKGRVLALAQDAMKSGKVLDVSYRTRHKNGNLIWIHVNGRRMGPVSKSMRFYAVFTGMSAEAELFQSIADETADGIYVIDKETYTLLYINESKDLFQKGRDCVGQKCYKVLHGKDTPCEFCTLESHLPDGKLHDMEDKVTGKYYSTRFREMNWNGIPAYVKYVQDITEEVKAKKEKDRFEQYYQTLVKNLPGGVAVIQYEKDGEVKPEYLSDGFLTMTDMSKEEAWDLYREDAMTGVHPEDKENVSKSLASFAANGARHCEIVYRLIKGDGSYVWVKNSISLIQSEGGEYKLYASYHDMTKEKEEQEQLQQQYRNLILQHYRTPGPNALIIGHCNISRSRILEIIDHTDSHLLETFGTERNAFFTGIAGLVVDEEERQIFLSKYLNDPAFLAYKKGDTEQVQNCFMKLPKEKRGRYVQVKVNLVETPDTGDITGILTITDITEQTISDRLLHRLSSASYDLVVDLNLFKDYGTVLSGTLDGEAGSEKGCSHSEHLKYILREQVVPRDKERVTKMLDPHYMYARLKKENAYSLSYSFLDKEGEILTKNLTVSAIDLRLGRVCLARADITDSVREQQGLFNVVADTFERLGFIHVNSGQFIMHTRQTVLKNLPPFIAESYSRSVGKLAESYASKGEQESIEEQFRLENLLKNLEEKPEGYNFVLPCQEKDSLRYKQIKVLWGDRDHKTVCMVRADVTDMLMAERQSKEDLERALTLAEKANRAKSDFLSSMSHDIRTPMNAIIGMTSLASAYADDRDRVEEYLEKIEVSSKYLLSLINDILDMNKIESSKISLNPTKIQIYELVEQLSSMLASQVKSAGLQFDIRTEGIIHPYFYGDLLRIKQIMINILSNAVKFTPEGGKVEFLIEEIFSGKKEDQTRYRFSIRDTGVGMSQKFMKHIFEPFSRGRKAELVEGTGLGLSITKGLVNLMGGTIQVESRELCGTTFVVELKCETARDGKAADACEEEAVAASVNENTKEEVIAGCRFLVAEDNAINAEILCELLKMYGAQSMVKTDGAQAVKEFRDTAPGTYDAILMDIQMPNMNGYDATRVIRKMEREDAADIPIIAMTANAFTEDIQNALAAGMTAHVAKPIDMQVLIDTLGRYINHKKQDL